LRDGADVSAAVHAASKCDFIEPDITSAFSSPALNTYRLCYLAGFGRASLAQQEVRLCWSAEAGDRAGVARTATALWLTTALMNGDAVCSVLWINNILNTCFTDCLYTVKLLLLETLCWNTDRRNARL